MDHDATPLSMSDLTEPKRVLLRVYTDRKSSPYLCSLVSEILLIIERSEVIGAFLKGIYYQLYGDDCPAPDLDSIDADSFRESDEALSAIVTYLEDAWSSGTRGDDAEFVFRLRRMVDRVRKLAAKMRMEQRIMNAK